MSTIKEKDLSLKKAAMPKKDYIEKIKCSAAPRLGLMFSKEAPFIHLLEKTMSYARTLVNKSVIPAIGVLCVALAILVNVIRKITGGVTFKRLDKLIAELKHLKSKHQSYSAQKAIKQKSEMERTISHSENERDCKCTDIKEDINFEHQRLQRISTYSCICLAHLQLAFLLYLIGCTQFKVGFVFLLACILCINAVLLKISFTTKSADTKRLTRKDSRDLETLNLPRPVNLLFSQIRSQRMEMCLQKAKLP